MKSTQQTSTERNKENYIYNCTERLKPEIRKNILKAFGEKRF
jgi:hypothetical protein